MKADFVLPQELLNIGSLVTRCTVPYQGWIADLMLVHERKQCLLNEVVANGLASESCLIVINDQGVRGREKVWQFLVFLGTMMTAGSFWPAAEAQNATEILTLSAPAVATLTLF